MSKNSNRSVFNAAMLLNKVTFDTCWQLLTLVGVSLDVWMKYKRCEEIKRDEERELKKTKIGF